MERSPGAERVGSLVDHASPVVREDFTLETLEALIADRDLSSFPVSDGNGRFRGFVSAGEVVRRRSEERDSTPPGALHRGLRVDPAPATVGDIRTVPGASVRDDASLEDAAARMIERDVERLAVVDATGVVVGVVSALDVLRKLAGRPAGAAIENAPASGPHGRSSPPAASIAAPVTSAREPAARLDVIRAFAMESSLTGAALRALETLRTNAGSSQAMLWVVDEVRRVLRCVAVSSDTTTGAASPAVHFASMIALGEGDGPAGRAWVSHHLEVETGGPGDVERIAVPLPSGGRTIGVLELYRTASAPLSLRENEALLDLAAELGRLVDARRSELVRRAGDAPTSEPLAPPSVLFFDAAGRLTFECGPSLSPEDEGGRRSRGLEPAPRDRPATESEHPVARGVRRAAGGHSFSELCEIPGLGTRCLAFSPVRERSGSIAGVVAVGIDGVRARGTSLSPGTTAARLPELGAGAAHELNNALTTLRLSRDTWAANATAIPSTLPGMSQAMNRIERVAQALAAVARDENGSRMLDLRVVLDGVLALLAHRVDARLSLVRRYGDVPLVHSRANVLHGALVDSLLAVLDTRLGDAREHELRVSASTDAHGLVVATLELVSRGDAEPRTRSDRGRSLGTVVDAARELVRELGGDLVAHTSDDRVVIHVALPTQVTSTAHSAEKPRRAGPSRKRVLVIDDDVAVADAIAHELSPHEVTIADGGRRALQILFRPHEFDVVLCDLMMPEVTGMDVYELVRLHDAETARRFVFMTGAAFTNRASAFLEEVPNARILKPFSGEALRRAVAPSASASPSVAPE